MISPLGCKRNSRLTVAPVHGQVTYKGQGVPNATVIFIPSGETAELLKRMRPFAYADGQGIFDLKTYVRGDGAPPGTYRVSIIAGSGVASPGKDARAEPAASPASPNRVPPLISQKYENEATSGIEVTVQNGENNLPPFELK